MRIATFNVQNMRLRHSKAGVLLTGARDMDAPVGESAVAKASDTIDRQLTAEVLCEADADIVAMQEVFDRETLDYFHDRILVAAGAAPYPHRVCLPGNDGRGYDIALMSRIPLEDVASHADLTPGEIGLDPEPGCDANGPVFRRDCLSARAGELTLFVCHFKAPWPDPEIAWTTRRQEALAVRRLVERAFPDPAGAEWLILGDLNEPQDEPRGERASAPLTEDFAVDLVARLPEERRWSYHMQDTGIYSRPDALLASPALARRFPDAAPFYLRRGLGHEAARFAGKRLPGVGYHRPHASDHAALVIDFKGS
jgi:endonuclease/exonuclease/phosphatase family metal-dependent hydrolase